MARTALSDWEPREHLVRKSWRFNVPRCQVCQKFLFRTKSFCISWNIQSLVLSMWIEVIQGHGWCKPGCIPWDASSNQVFNWYQKYWIEVGTKRKQEGTWDVVCFSNSDYAEDPVTRRSISDFVLYVLGVPASWWSNAQRSMTLSSSEAEWLVLLEAVKEVMLIVKLLWSMKISDKFLVMVRVDNEGGNIYGREHCCCQSHQALSGDLHEKHSKKMICEKLKWFSRIWKKIKDRRKGVRDDVLSSQI